MGGYPIYTNKIWTKLAPHLNKIPKIGFKSDNPAKVILGIKRIKQNLSADSLPQPLIKLLLIMITYLDKPDIKTKISKFLDAF